MTLIRLLDLNHKQSDTRTKKSTVEQNNKWHPTQRELGVEDYEMIQKTVFVIALTQRQQHQQQQQHTLRDTRT